MKLIRFNAGKGPETGVVVGGDIVGLEVAKSPLTDIMEIVAGGTQAVQVVAESIAGIQPHHHLEEVDLLAPISRPGKYLAIATNYIRHQEEAERLGVVKQKCQVWFNKQTSCISGPFDDIDPGVTEQLDYEVELGVIIGKVAKGVRREKADEHVFGYFIANDVSARDWQFHSPTFTIGKSFDTHGPIGPWIVTADEIPDPHNLELRCFVNGEQRQASNTSLMIHDIYTQIAYLSTAFTLEPGDLIATGTPEGVGVARNPPVFLKQGDLVRCEIECIGAIENRIASANGIQE